MLLVGGCSGQGNAELGNAEAAASSFTTSVATAPDRACDLLAPQTLADLEDSEGPCATSLPEQVDGPAGPVESAQVYGKDAIVHFGSGTVFLARFADGWRVTAAGCTPSEAGRPYDCTVKGS